MTVREILIWPDSRLMQRSKEVTDFGSELQDLIRDMLDTVHKQGIGLAAVQIGVHKRVLVMNDKQLGMMEIVNPKLEYTKEPFIFKGEGCLSLPGEYFDTQRFRFVGVSGQTRTGNKLMLDFVDLEAVEFQHELDHLDGKLLVTRPEVSYLKRDIIRRRLKKLKKA